MPLNSAIAENQEYRIAMIHPVSKAVLTTDGTGALPRISIPVYTRVTQQAHRAIEAAWSLRGFILDYLSSERDSSPCAVLELLHSEISASLRWRTVDEIDDLTREERRSILSIIREDSTSSLLRVGWVYEAIEWVENVTGEALQSVSEIEQLNAGGGFTLLRLPMRSERSYWLKATAAPNSHELPITVILSKLCRGYVPEVLDVKPEWNAWLTADGGTAHWQLPSCSEQRFHVLECAATVMAEIQCRTTGCEEELIAAGACDHRIDTLRSESELLFERIGQAMHLQTSIKAPRLELSRLHELRTVFNEVCDFLHSLAIPNSIIHGDMNLGNVLFGDHGCRFIDWCEAYVGHPLVTLQHLLLMNVPGDVHRKAIWDRRLIERYCAVMNEICDPDALARAVPCMPLIAAASAMYGRGKWLRSPVADAPSHRQMWIRTLARYMDRAARDSALLNAVSEQHRVYG